jgi:hypothetical protein
VTVIRITPEQAAAAIRAAAPGGTIATLSQTDSGYHPDVYTMEVAMLFLRDAKLIAYQAGPFGYDLVALTGAVITHFDVPMLAKSPTEAFLAEYGGLLVEVLANAECGDAQTSLRMDDALRALYPLLEES